MSEANRGEVNTEIGKRMPLFNIVTTPTLSRRMSQSSDIDDTLPRIRFQMPRWSAMVLPLLIALLVITPLFLLASEILTPTPEIWEQMWNGSLPRAITNTVILMVGVGIGTFVIGTGAAWLVTAYDFPGRRFFDHAFLLPLAVPTFVMGFVFLAIFEYAGPVQTQWRAWFGKEAWFPDVHSTGGVLFVMTIVLYPYVYILARAAFREQAASTFEAARMMGYNRTQTFFRLVLPLARPSLVAGAILAIMEAMTDFGAVKFFSFPTLSERVVILWQTNYDRGPATELASMLFFLALGMIILERILRGQAKYYQNGGARGRRMQRVRINGWKRWLPTFGGGLLLIMAFFLPVYQLIVWSIQEISNPSSVGNWQASFGGYVGNTLTLGLVAAGVTLVFALIVSYGVRSNSVAGKRAPVRFLARLTTLGYAMPGAVVAAGVLFFVSPFDGALTRFAMDTLGRTDRSLLLTGTMIALIYAYVVRFMAVSFNSVDSSMEKVTPNMEQAARTLGAGSFRVVRRVHVPLISTGMAAGAILVFVDVMKELPATLMLRPFGMDTLALWAYFLASESFWQAAAIPSLTILVVGLIPVFILMRVGDGNRDESANH